MPREGVPYPERALCSLRCAIQRIEQALGLKMNSVNGVGPDGQGDVKLISDSSALSVTDDPVQHEVHLDLDTSLLPAADVNSVNGQTGVVSLTADDIPSDGSSDVQADIDALKAADTTLQGNINAEALARQNADSTLQTNINASNLRISNIENAISADPDPDTIGLRDANGRLKAADPASGATDKTLVTANWISQTGNSAPNNAVHRSGDETVNGTKTMESIINVNSLDNRCVTAYGYGNDSTECWWKFYEKTNVSWHKGSFIHIYDLNAHTYSIFYISGFGTGASGQAAFKLMGSFSETRIRVARKDSLVSVFVQTTSATNRPYAWISFDLNGVTNTPHALTPNFLTVTPVASTEPTVGADYDAVITPTVIQ